MIVLADRNFAARDRLVAVADTGADLLVRVKIGRNLPVCRRLPTAATCPASAGSRSASSPPRSP